MRKIIIISIVFFCSNSFAWENKVTHKDLSEAASKRSLSGDLLDKQYVLDGRKLSIREWIQEGAELEDSGSIFKPSTARYRNHFHNPLANMAPPVGALTDGGLTDAMTGQSAVLWAQDKNNQKNFDQGDWSWSTVRDHYFSSLTGTTQADVDAFTARTYLGLGYQMHLLQDMGQPDHVRNDAHPIDGSGYLWGFETWARDRRPLIKQYAATATKPTVDLTQPFYDGYSPIARLMDTRGYKATTTPNVAMSQGLSEYTNANFFSDDTIFAARFATDDKHYFPYPRKEGTDIQRYFNGTKAAETVISEDGKAVKGLWISKTGEGETVPHLVRVGPMAKLAYNVFGEGSSFYTALGRDEIVYDDYAQKLVPRSVGYSAALLDYFFRGKIELQPITSSDTLRFIRVKATNVTTTGEEMPSGEVSLVIKYKLRSETNSVMSLPNSNAPWYYRVVNLAVPVEIPKGSGAEYLFDLGDNPLPLWATEVNLQLVYKGKLGVEEGAVAVGSVKLDKVTTDIALSLPASGVYAVATPSAAGFSKISVTAMNNTGLNLPDGRFKLLVRYRLAAAEPFQSVQVNTLPDDPDSYYLIRATADNGVNTLSAGVPKELAFTLPTPLPAWATDVYLYLIYHNNNDQSETPLALGFADISEPTPMDVFNNADKVCINNQWYDAGSAEAIALADNNHNGIADLFDPYAHDIANIYVKASAADNATLASPTNFTLQSPDLLSGGAFRRLGYILTDYTFKFSNLEEWFDVSPAVDIWEATGVADMVTGTAVKNQNGTFPGMFGIRGKKLWWGTGVVYDNEEYPAGGTADDACGWVNLP